MEKKSIQLLVSLLMVAGLVSCNKDLPVPNFQTDLYILIEDNKGNNLLEGDFDPLDINIGYSTTGEFYRFDSASYSKQEIVDTLGLKLLKFRPSPSYDAKEIAFFKIGEYSMDVIKCTLTDQFGFVIDEAWFNDELVYDSQNLNSLQTETKLPVFKIVK